MRYSCTPFLAVGLILTAGCHSANIEAVIRNSTDRPIELVEIDYPSASFGTQALMPGQEYHYRFKILGNGTSKLLWTDATHKEHTQAGPAFRESDEGKLLVTFKADGPVWETQLTNHGQRR